MSEQKLKKVGPREWTAIRLATSTNRRAAAQRLRNLQIAKGPAACLWCGAEPCGVQWTRPGDTEPGGERCCPDCSHEPVEGWQHTHTAWAGGQPFAVCALVLREGETVYLRRDGVVQFLELRAPQPGAELDSEAEADVPTIAFLGRAPDGAALHFAGEGGERQTSLWSNRRELDPLWLPVRMQAAVARDESRKRRRHEERLAREAVEEARLAALLAADQAKLEASVAKRALQHETRLVLDEVTMDDTDSPEDEVEMPAALAEPVVAAAPAAPAAPTAPVNLKEPAPVKKGPGRPKRSARQRRARERQKRAWARQEAKNRLEVKRLERLARTQAQDLVHGEKG